jgi:hypothetical protein
MHPVQVNVTPSGARVTSADGGILGHAPVTILLAKDEGARLKLSYDGYYSQTVTVHGDRASESFVLAADCRIPDPVGSDGLRHWRKECNK